MVFVGEFIPGPHQSDRWLLTSEAVQIHREERNVRQHIGYPQVVTKRNAVDQPPTIVGVEKVFAAEVTVSIAYPTEVTTLVKKNIATC